MINQLKNRLIPSVADVILISVLFYLTLFPDEVSLLSDGDTGYHIRAGEYILNTLSIPKNDIFSFITPTLPWTAHEWLAEVVMAMLHQVGGLTAVVIFFAFMIAVSIRLFFRNILAEGNNIMLAVIACIMFIVLAKIHWLARPHIFSLIILLVWYRILDDYQYRQINRLWILPLIMLLWVNLHGGFVIGLVLMGIYFAGNSLLKFTDPEQWQLIGKAKTTQLVKIICISIIVCLANPVGYKIFLFPFKLISNKYIMDNVSEFLSPNFHELQPFKYLLFLLIILLAYSKRRTDFIEIVLIIFFTSMSLTSVRYIPLFAVIVIPILLSYIEGNCLSAFPKVEQFLLQRVENITLIDTEAKGYLWPVVSLVLLVFLASNGRVSHAFDPEKKPLAAIEFLKTNPVSGNMFNNDEFGDLVIYRANYQYKVFLDGRNDMYGTELLKEYARVRSFEPGWEKVLNKYKISWIFFDTNSVLSRFLYINNDWKLIYSDKVASIFVKDTPMHKSLIDKFTGIKLANYSTSLTDKKL